MANNTGEGNADFTGGTDLEQEVKQNIAGQGLDSNNEQKQHRFKGMFLATITGMSVLGGFGLTMGMAKKADPTMFERGIASSKELPESGVSLAFRALARGTLYSCTGFGLVCFAIWKLMGVHNMAEFREKVGTALPRIPKSENPGRGDFKTLRDLMEYIIAEDEKEKLRKTKEKTISQESPS